MAVTLQQIADQLQISKATVSRSLRNDPLILPKTRAKVHTMAVQLGYEGRPRAQRHKTKADIQGVPSSQGVLGLLSRAANLDQARRDFSFVQIMQGVMTEAESTGMLLMAHTIPTGNQMRMEEDPAQVPTMVRESACKALIVRGAIHADDIAFLSRHMPVVSIGRIYHESPVDAVVPDSFVGVRTLVTRLVELGHRRLAWVGAHYEATFIEERHAGFVSGCLQNGLDLGQQRFLGQEIYVDRRVHAQDKLLQLVREGTTAMVCVNDSTAEQVIKVLESGGLHVPQDVSVTGFDAYPHPIDGGRHITSIDPRFTELGRAAVRLAVQRLTQSPAPPCVLTVRSELVPGDTIAGHPLDG
jgi:LacI family transcriptional regulator